MKRQDFIQAIPVILLSLISLYAIFTVFTTNAIFEVRQHVGITLLSVSVALFFINRKLYKYLFGLVLVLGTFNLVAFSASIFSVSIFGVWLQPISAGILLIFFMIHRDDEDWIFGKRKQQDVKAPDPFRKVDFKFKYRLLSKEAIARKLDEETDPEVIEALEELAQEKADMGR